MESMEYQAGETTKTICMETGKFKNTEHCVFAFQHMPPRGNFADRSICHRFCRLKMTWLGGRTGVIWLASVTDKPTCQRNSERSIVLFDGSLRSIMRNEWGVINGASVSSCSAILGGGVWRKYPIWRWWRLHEAQERSTHWRRWEADKRIRGNWRDIPNFSMHNNASTSMIGGRNLVRAPWVWKWKVACWTNLSVFTCYNSSFSIDRFTGSAWKLSPFLLKKFLYSLRSP